MSNYSIAVAALLAVASASAAEPAHILVVAAAPPLDGDRLAESLRAYLDGYDVTVEVHTAPAAPDLRAQLDATRAAGQRAGAFASIRIAAEGGSVEIQLADQLAAKALIASIPRARRDEDLYRAIALKVQSLLRTALAESAPALATTAPSLSRLATPPAATVTAHAASTSRRLSLDVGWALVSFPLGAVIQNGVSVGARFDLHHALAVGLSIAALDSIRAARDDVAVVGFTIPICARLAVHGTRSRVEGELAAVGELLVVGVDPTSATTAVRADRFVEPAAGVEAEGRLRLTSVFGLYARASVLGVFLGQRYTVNGAALIDLSHLQVGANAGLVFSVW